AKKKEEETTEEPKKGKKKAEEKTEEPKKGKKKVEEKPAAEETPPVVEEPQKEAPPVIENIQAKKLSGPKIMGKIELPVDNDTRPKKDNLDEKRKRKRIPMERKGGQQTGGQQQGSPQQGQGGFQNRRPGGSNIGQGPNRGGGGNRFNRGSAPAARREDKV